MDRIFKKIGVALLANIINAVATFVISFIVPRMVTVEEYGYFQVYFFYVTYVGFFHFGLCDGILLKEGGRKYSDLNYKSYSAQFYLMVLMDGIIAALISCVAAMYPLSEEYRYVYILASLNIVVLCAQAFLLYILQATSRIKEYSTITISYRLFSVVCYLIMYILGVANVYALVMIDFLGKLLSVLIGLYWCKEITAARPRVNKVVLCELKENVQIGSQILFANVSSILTSGIVKMGIQFRWSIETYAKVSLAITLTNVFMTVVNAVSLVLYPTLRNQPEERLKSLYPSLRNILFYPVCLCLAFYYPMQKLICWWLPQYSESMGYLALLFPLCIFITKSSMLVITYLKVLREEKAILRSNIVGILFAVVTTIVSVVVFENLQLAVLSILVNTIVRTVVAEHKLAKYTGHNIKANVAIELFVSAVFVISHTAFNGIFGLIVYGATLLVVCFVNRSEILLSFKQLLQK